MHNGTFEVPTGWSHLYVGEARKDLKFLVKRGGLVLVHSHDLDEKSTVDAGKVLSALKKCVCGSKELKSCTCDSFIYQDREGVYHFVTHSLLITMEAQGEENDLAVIESGRRLS